MTPERWRQVEDILHAALAHGESERAAFLLHACANDLALRREVEALLAQQASSFLEVPAVAAAAQMVSDATGSLQTGRRLGAYQVHACIGVGGMGEVYRARDMKLGRDVAIKILPRLFTSDPDRLARFEREARVLASLNHPHIGAIYGLEDVDGVRTLVLELVDGETLADRIAHGPIPLNETLTIGRQIADALEAAHEKGIVHRDLKPANIKITRDGIVKVLDFGLARIVMASDMASDSRSPTITIEGTREGLVMGTAAYMSPEQARGQSVDKRTDIWAFGCVLYEMPTARLAFAAETVADTIAAVLEREPDWAALPPSMPTQFTRALHRCLEKDPKRRLRDIGDLRIEIDDALAAGPRLESTPVRSASRESWPWNPVAFAFMGVLAVAALIAGTLLIGGRVNVSSPSAVTTQTRATRLTDYGGSETYGALSPDARSFVFVSGHGGAPDIWLRQVSGGEPIRLTNDEAEEANLTYSPDGETVYFTRLDSKGSAIWQVGVLGGQPRKVLDSASRPALSPDGRRIAFTTGDPEGTGTALAVSALTGEGRRFVARKIQRIAVGASPAAWSRDGLWLAYSRGALFGPNNLFVIEIATGRERQVTEFTGSNEGIIGQHWLPDNRHLIVSYVSRPGQLAPTDLGILDVQNGSIARLTVAVGDGFFSPNVSADGSRLLAVASHNVNEVWKVPFGPDADANGRAAARLMDTRGTPMWTFVSRDGRLLLFNSTATGSRNLWLTRLDEKTPPRQVTALANDVVAHSSLSPDGSHVAFVSTASAGSHIWTQNMDGSGLRQLTDGDGSDSWPVWSPDGRSIVYTSDRGERETWRVPVGGGAPERLMAGYFRGDWIALPDGRSLIISSDGGNGVRLIDVERRAVLWEKSLQGVSLALPLFNPDGRLVSIPFRKSRDLDAIQVLDVATGASRVVANLPFHVAFRASWVDKGTAFIVNSTDAVSHIVMFDRFWKNERTP